MGNKTDELRETARALRAEFEAVTQAVSDSAALQALRDRFLGRKSGALSGLLKSLGQLGEAERRELGQELNALKAEIEARLAEAQARLEARLRQDALVRERVDTSLPGRRPYVGRRHPLTVVRQELEDIFVAMGYEVYDGPEVEDDYHNFEALNMPPDHPARDMQDTFYLEEPRGLLLRTHTSSVADPLHARERAPAGGAHHLPGQGVQARQRRHALADVPADRGAGGRQGDPPRTPEGHDRGLPARALRRGVPGALPRLVLSVHRALGRGRPRLHRVRRIGPLAEQSACRVCKATGWLEILGSGMVHPAVFEAVNARLGRAVYDPEEVTGFAFGLGIERVAMVRHGIDDIRLFYENDLRFLEQFPS